MDPAVPKRASAASRRFLDVGERGTVSDIPGLRFPVGGPVDPGSCGSAVLAFSLSSAAAGLWPLRICSSAETVFAGRGSNGLPSMAASANMLNAPFADVDRPGPRSARRVGRFFAARDVGFRVYRS